MSIPASVTFYSNFTHGSYSDPTYTAAAPEDPSNQTWTSTEVGTGTVARVAGGAGWASGQYVMEVTSPSSGNDGTIRTTVSSSLIPTNQSRIYVEIQGWIASRLGFYMRSDPTYEHLINIVTTAGSVTQAYYQWRGTNSLTIPLGISVSSTDVHCIEMILDPNNATESQRFRVRTWVLGGSPPSFTDATANSTSARNDNFAWDFVQWGDERYIGKGGRVIVSDDIAEDLSNVTEGGGAAVYAFQ